MSTIVTRAGKGSPLTNNEVDSNFTNLNTDKVETITSADGSVVVSSSGTTRDLSVGIAGSTATLISQVRNETGAALTKGTVVYISGASGNKAVVSKARANSDSTSAQTYGVVQADIPNNQNGYVVVIGAVSGLNTSAFTDGTQLYLSGTTAGEYTSTKPSAPTHLVYVGVVTYSHATQGTIQVKIQNGYEMDELHDVAISSLVTGQILVYNASTGLWSNSSVLSSYLPLAGGTLTGGVTLNASRFYVSSAASGQPYNATIHIRDGEATGANNSFAGIAFSSSPGADYVIGKYSNSGTGYLEIRNHTAASLWRMDSTGAVTQAGALLINNGANLIIQAASGSTDSGDIVFRNGSGEEVHRLWDNGGDGLSHRYNAGTAYRLLTAGNYNSYSPSLTGSGASGTWGISITGNSGYASYSGYAPLLSNSGQYVWSASTTPTGYSQGVQTSFVRNNEGWQSFGSVMTMNTYSGGGGALQLYVPYSPTYGGTGLQVRFGNYDVSSGNAWTSWKTLLASDNYSSYALPLSGGDMTGRIRMGTFANSQNNTGEAWIGRASDRSTGTFTVQLGNSADRVFEVVDNAWSQVIFAAGMNALNYKGSAILHAGNYTSYRPPVLAPINTTASGVSNWNPGSLTYQAWGQYFTNSNISGDSGDLTLWLRPSQYSGGGTELNMYIDGDFYSGINQRVLNASNFSSYALPLSGGTVTGLTYFTASESLQLKGIRGQFAGGSDGQGIHLYSNVDIGYPSGWGGGFGYTPSQGLSTYGGIRAAYGNGMVAWNGTTPGTGVGAVHLGSASATGSSGMALTWGARDSSSGATAQAGIYIVSDGSYGTRMYLATTDSYVTGSRSAVSIDEGGNVNVMRGTLKQGGNQVLHAGNYGSYSAFGGKVTSAGNNGFANDVYYSGVRNPIWSFGNASSYGISYYQGTAGIGSQDSFGVSLNGTTSVTSNNFAVGVSNSYVNNNVILHAGNYTNYTLPLGGGWYGSGLPGSRWNGLSVSGGEIVFGNGLPNAGQLGILVDGCYVAGENNGFWSMGSDNSWGSRRGMYWDGSYLNFTTNTPTARFQSFLCDGSPTISGTLSTGDVINLGYNVNGSIATSARRGIDFHYSPDTNYWIGKRGGAWTQPLDVSFYTGIRYHAHRSYGGHRFYIDGYDSTLAMTIGDNGSGVNVTSSVTTSDWFYINGGNGVYWNSYGRGIRAADNEYSYGNIGTYGAGLNGWRGYAIYPNNCILMAGGSSVGIYNPSGGIWLQLSDMSGNITFAGNVTAYSDLRLKHNVREIDDVVARRNTLAKSAIKYERDGRIRIGYGAQTLRDNGCPEFVMEADDAMKLATGLGTLSVDYGETAAVLAVASKMTDDRVAALEAKIAKLEAIIETLIGD